MTVGSLKEPFELFGVECLSGWKKLIKPLFDYIAEYNLNKPDHEQIQILQVKEKFAGLRFYVSHYTEELQKLIDDAEKKSYTVCEECGNEENVGVLKIGGWYYTRCRNCAQKLVDYRRMSGRFKIGDEIIILEPNKD